MLILISCHGNSADLLEVYHLAQNNDPTFEAARYALAAAQEKIPQARAGFLPVVNVNGNANTTYASSTYTGIPTINQAVRAWTWTLQLTQPLIRVQNFFAYTESKSLVNEATAQFAQAEQDLILRVARAYFDVLVAKESISVTESQLRAAMEQMAAAQRGFKMGINPITDVDEAEARTDLARSQRVTALNELESKRAELEKIVDPPPDLLAALRPILVIPNPEPDNPYAWVEQARKNNPAVLASRDALAAADDEIQKNQAQHLPTLDMVASYGSSFSSGNVAIPSEYATATNDSVVGLQLTVPLFAGGLVNSQVSAAIANKYKAMAEMEIARRQAGTDARQAYAAIFNGLAQIAALKSAVESSQSAVKGNQVGYQLGIHMNIDVLNAEQQLYTAQRDLLKARYETLFQGLKLKAAAGALSEPDLVTINGFLVH